MGSKKIIPTGTRFGHLKVIKEVKSTRRRFLCKCDCGNEKEIALICLTTGKTVTCGCRKWVKTRENYDEYLNKKYGRLTIIEIIPRTEQYAFQMVKCRCDCGNIKTVKLTYLKNGDTKSCGCLIREMNWIDGRKHERLHSVWNGMISRCKYEKLPAYERYGGRGISVCEEWKDYLNFKEWALNNGYKDDLTLDRRDNNGDYEPSNCRWVDLHTQANNTRRNVFLTYNDETHTIAEWSRITGISQNRLYYRYTHGFSIEEIFSTKRLPKGGFSNGKYKYMANNNNNGGDFDK